MTIEEYEAQFGSGGVPIICETPECLRKAAHVCGGGVALCQECYEGLLEQIACIEAEEIRKDK